MNNKKLPHVILKYASTLNGIIGSNKQERLILSNDLDHKRVMELRAQVDAILIGAGTLVKDNPELTVRDEALVRERLSKGRSPQPKRVVLARESLEDTNLKLLQDKLADTIVFQKIKNPKLPKHIEQICFTDTNSRLLNALEILKMLGVNSVLIEGGAKIISEVLSLGIANDIRILYSPQFLSSGVRVPMPEGVSLNIMEKKIERMGDQFALRLRMS